MRTRAWTILCLVATLASAAALSCQIGINPDDDDAAPDLLRAEPSSIDFGDVAAGSSQIERFELFNETGTLVTLTRLSITQGADAFQFVTPPEDGYQLDTGASRVINVRFAPDEEDESDGTVVLSTDHPDYPTVEVALHGCSLPGGCGGGDDDDTADDDDSGDDDDTGGQCGSISVTPSSVNFGTVTVGSSSQQLVSIANVGSEDLDVTSATVTGGAFGASGFTPPVILSPSDSTTVQVSFSPTSSGTATGSLVIASCDAAQPQVTVPLEGTGDEGCNPNCDPRIEVTPTSIDFGTVTGLASESLTVTNVGVDPLHLTAVTGCSSTAGGTVSVASGNTTATIPPGASEYFTIQWTPGEMFPGQGCLDALGQGQNVLTIQSDATNAPIVSVDLEGCCDAATGGMFCSYADLIDLLMCMDSAGCGDAVSALFYCAFGIPC